MSLKETLDAMKAESAKKIPAEAMKIMLEAREALKKSEILNRALKKGVKAPSFELDNTEGESVNSADILARGPLVLHFYRGAW